MAAEPTTLEPITVVVPDPTPAAVDDGVPVTPPKTADTEKSPKQPKVTAETDQTVDDLRKQVEQANAATAEANRRANEAQQQAQRQQAEAVTQRNAAEQARYDTINTALESATSRMTALESELEQAYERGDHKAAAKAQVEIARLTPRIAQLEDGKAEMDDARKNPPRQEAPPPRAPADPVEAYASQLTPKSAAWVRAHPQFVTNRAQNYRLLAAHQEAIDSGIPAESDGYYAHIEKTLGLGGEADSPPVRQQREKPVAAPVTRGMAPNGVGHDNASGQKVTLTPEMRATARALDMTDIEYATYLKQARTDGRLN